MSTSVKVLLGPQDTDFGIARLVELPDGADRIEVFDEAGKVWRVSSNPDLTLWDLAKSEPLSPATARRLGLTDPDTDASNLPPAPTLGEAIPGFKEAVEISKNRKVKPELKAQSDKLVKAAVRNLHFNVLNDIDCDAPESERQAAYARLSFSKKGLNQVEKMAKLGYDRRSLIPGQNGMPVYDRELDEELNSYKRLKAKEYAVDYSFLSADKVLKPETFKAVLRGSLRMQKIADRWALGWPKKVKAMEASGQLLPRLKEQAALEAETIAKARASWPFSDTPDSELLAMYEIPALPD